MQVNTSENVGLTDADRARIDYMLDTSMFTLEISINTNCDLWIIKDFMHWSKMMRKTPRSYKEDIYAGYSQAGDLDGKDTQQNE